jgi:hypothetical protein
VADIEGVPVMKHGLDATFVVFHPPSALAMTGSGRVPTYAGSNPNAIGSHVGARAGAAIRGCEGKFR